MNERQQPKCDTAALFEQRLSRRALLRAGMVGAAGLSVAGLLAACGGATGTTTSSGAGGGQAQGTIPSAGTAPAQAGAKVSLTWAIPGNPDEVKVYQTLAESFMKQNPNIEVKTDRDASDYQKTVTLIAGGTAPDLLFATINNWPAFATKNVFLPLDDYIKKDSYDLDDFYPQILKPYKYDGQKFGDGQLYGLPKEIAIRSMYYNADIFKEAGVTSLPTADDVWDWGRFSEVTQATTKAQDGRTTQYGYVQETWWGPWMIWAWAAGGEAVDDPFNPTRSTLDSPQVLEGYQTWTDFVTKLKTAPPAAVTKDQGKSEMFAGGRGATYNNGRWMVPLFRKSTFKWDVMPMPQKAQRAQLLTGSIFGIYKGSKSPDAAWKLLSYVVGKEGQQKMTELGLLLPSRKSVANSDLFLKSTPPENNRVYLDELQYAKVLPLHPKYPEMEKAINDENDLVFGGQKSAADALKVMHQKVNELLKS
jgi:multiple sugar transport system substrate-binding protein